MDDRLLLLVLLHPLRRGSRRHPLRERSDRHPLNEVAPPPPGIIALRRNRVHRGETRPMTMAGLPLVEQLPPANGSAIVLLGGDETLAEALRRAGYRVDRHALDTGPLVQPREGSCTATFV